jgi:hypothetical protein
MRQTAYYDRDVGIVYLTVVARRRRRRRGGRTITGKDHGWGLVMWEGGEVCGLEFWRPEEIFPPDVLAALPSPIISSWERRRSSIRRPWEVLKWKLWKERRWRRWHNSPEGIAAQAELEPPRPFYRGLPGPPGEADERSDIAWQP